ncbi:MAG: heavy-metal-associated domain-containing protein [Hydrogenophaga sp.]|jgi:copper chaperone
MTSLNFDVENIKCGGCENTIRKGLSTIAGVSEVQIDRDQQRITLVANEADRGTIAEKLRSMGYPEQGSVAGLQSGLAQAKSMVSCAIGKVSG